MNVQEMRVELLKLKSVVESPEVRAFVERVPTVRVLQFFRPLVDDVVLAASVRNLSEEEAFAVGVEVLDTLEKRWGEVADREVTKLVPWAAGPSFADALLVLGRDVAKVAPTKGYVFPSRTVAGYPINHIEWTGEETAVEATVRKKDAHINDYARTPSPIIFGRYQLTDGAGSAKHFAVAPLATVLSILKNVVREGGRFEIENYEREGCLLTTTAGSGSLEMRIGGVERTVTHDEVIQHIHTLTHKGVATLLQELTN